MAKWSVPALVSPLGALVVAWAVVCGAASANALVHEQDLPFGPAAAAALVDLTGDGQPELVLAGEEGIAVFALPGPADGTTWQLASLLPPLPAPVTAVAGGDVTSDGVPELAVGTGNAGSIYVFTWTGRRWTLLGQTPYLWSPVRSLEVGDLDGDGRNELVAVTGAGELLVFGWRERNWHTLFRSPAAWSPVLHARVADVTGEGRPQLVLADQSGAVAVWRWPLVEPLAQGFVWGTPVSMAVVDLDGTGSPQVIVTTSERLLYRFVWQKQGLTLAGAPVYDNRLPLESMHALRWAGETRVSIAARHAGGLGLWRISPSGLELVAAGAANPVWVLPLPGGRRLLVGEPAHPVSTWVRVPADYLALKVNGNVWTLQDPPLFQGDQVLVSMRDWASILRLGLYWDAASQRLTAVGGNRFAVLTMGDPVGWFSDGIRLLPAAPVLRSGRIYAPAAFAQGFGASVYWDARRRELALEVSP